MGEKMDFKISDDFYLDDQHTKLISGSIHYFRSTPDMWDDILDKLKQLGCNTVETYVPWNLHQPIEEEFAFQNSLDIVDFLKRAQNHGLLAIVRIGPYMCAEADYGGLPWWLQTKDLRIRSDDDLYLNYVEKYFIRLIEELRPMFLENGGNIIMGQLENEFGSYSNNKNYLYKLHQILVNCNFSPALVTSDGTWGNMLDNGSMHHQLGILPTVNFGSEADIHFKKLQEYVGLNEKVPYMCMEFWCGWFTSWGDKQINKNDYTQVAKELDNILKLGSVNFYMFHGGTNFANISGANKTKDDGYMPHITSYDYDALLDERGNITGKYLACREVISKYVHLEKLNVVENKSMNYGKVKYEGSNSLLNENDIITNSTPLSIEELGYGYGYVNYRLKLKNIRMLRSLDILKLTDRAYLKVNNELVQILEGDESYHLDLDYNFDSDPVIDILFECNPRINYGMHLEQTQKGLLHGVFVNNHFFATGYEHFKIDINKKHILDNEYLSNYELKEHISKFTINIVECSDTYLNTTNLGKGYAFINGRNLGRFWDRGPQYKLFIPRSFLHEGVNTIHIIDIEKPPVEFDLIE